MEVLTIIWEIETGNATLYLPKCEVQPSHV